MKRFNLAARLAASTVHYGGVIAYPTEGVFGLGCDPFNADAVGRILDIKKRPVSKGLILIADHIDRLRPFMAELSEAQLDALRQSWPGPNTWVVPHNGSLPEWITGNRDTVAMRVTAHPVAAAICRQWRAPLVSTSANRSGRPALERQLQVRMQLAQEIDYLVPGRVQTPGQASTITDLVSGQTFRA